MRVFNNVHVPVVLHRLASRGYVPKTAEERQLFIDISTKLANAKANNQIPTTVSAPKLSKFAAASAALDNVLNSSEAAHEQQLKQATQQLLQDESIYAATVALLDA